MGRPRTTLFAFVFCWPLATAKCARNKDCHLNGVCDHKSGACVCDAPWAGEQCQYLDAGSADPVGAYGWSPNVSSWGGAALEIDGEYHMWVSEMACGCGLKSYNTNSFVRHVVAKNPQGPYTASNVTVGVFSHSTACVRNTTANNGTLMLFHRGSGK